MPIKIHGGDEPREPVTFRIEPARWQAWARLAKDLYHEAAIDLLRDIIEEFIAYHIDDSELSQLGMAKYIGVKERGLFEWVRILKQVRDSEAKILKQRPDKEGPKVHN